MARSAPTAKRLQNNSCQPPAKASQLETPTPRLPICASAGLVIGIAAKSPSRDYSEHDKMTMYQRSPVGLTVTGGASINELGPVAAGPFYFSWTSSTRLFFFRPQRSTAIRNTANQFGKTDKMRLRISFSIRHRLFLYRSRLRPRWTSLASPV